MIFWIPTIVDPNPDITVPLPDDVRAGVVYGYNLNLIGRLSTVHLLEGDIDRANHPFAGYPPLLTSGSKQN